MLFSSDPPALPDIHTLSLHDALPISAPSVLPLGEVFVGASRAKGAWSWDTRIALAYAAPTSADVPLGRAAFKSEEHTSELQSRRDLVCRLLLEKKKHKKRHINADRML